MTNIPCAVCSAECRVDEGVGAEQQQAAAGDTDEHGDEDSPETDGGGKPRLGEGHAGDTQCHQGA